MAFNRRTNRLLSAAYQCRAYSAPAERSIPAAKQKYVPTSGTYPKGFLAGSSRAGVKASNTKYDDIALIASETPCAAAAVFTRNIFKAAPVVTSRATLHRTRGDRIRGVVINSGCANAVTGERGVEDAMTMARVTDQCFGEEDPQAVRTLTMSTGVIGQRLPMDKVKEAIPIAHATLGSSHERWMKAAHAICTTDTFPKLISRTFTLPSHPDTEYRIAGMTKGAGMIRPNMGTLLGVICTDVNIHSDSMYRFLAHGVNRSFNSISIDGDTSTNDTVAFFANGAASPPGTPPLQLPAPRLSPRTAFSPDVETFRTVVKEFMIDLAKLVVRDGEGATKFVTIRVLSDAGVPLARRVAESIATSPLVKTALYGKDANWGRILCAIGYAPGVMPKPGSGITVKTSQKLDAKSETVLAQIVHPNRTSVSFVPADGSEELKLFTRGEPETVDEVRAKEILEMEDLEILVKLQDDGGNEVPEKRTHEAVFWTCDFSHEYVTINGDYRT